MRKCDAAGIVHHDARQPGANLRHMEVITANRRPDSISAVEGCICARQLMCCPTLYTLARGGDKNYGRKNAPKPILLRGVWGV